eukprot:7417793-Lingulodinium_polyedra.AAC.1
MDGDQGKGSDLQGAGATGVTPIVLHTGSGSAGPGDPSLAAQRPGVGTALGADAGRGGEPGR